MRASATCRRSPGSGAFTLIEVLVAVSIIGILLALLIPAIQAAREAARRAQCVSNLRQIGVALQAYESVHKMFPPGELTDRYGVVNNQYSEESFLLPYIEQASLFNSLNMSFHDIEKAATPLLANQTARNTRIAVYLCPSDGEPNHLNSYRFNRGRYGRRGSSRLLYDGPFGMGVIPRVSAITDGLSRTAFVSERLGGSFVPGARDPRRDIKVPSLDDAGSGASSDGEAIPMCLDAPPLNWEITAGRYWLFGDFVNTGYNHNGTPNDRRPTCGPSIGASFVGSPGGLDPPRSYHPTAVKVLFGDGHVEEVSDSVDQSLWTAMGTYDFGD